MRGCLLFEFLCVLSFLVSGFLCITLCNARFLAMCCLSLVYSLNIFPIFAVIERCPGYTYLCLHLWYFSVCITSSVDFLAFLVSIEKLGVILIHLPIFVISPFSLPALIFFFILYALCFNYYMVMLFYFFHFIYLLFLKLLVPPC